MSAVHVDRLYFYAGIDLREISADRVLLALSNFVLAAQAWGIFTARVGGSVEDNLAVFLNFRLHQSMCVVLHWQRDRNPAKRGAAIHIDGERHGALIIERKFAGSGEFGGSVQPHLVLWNVRKGVIEHRESGSTIAYVAKLTCTDESEFGIDAGSA